MGISLFLLQLQLRANETEISAALWAHEAQGGLYFFTFTLYCIIAWTDNKKYGSNIVGQYVHRITLRD